MADYTKFIVYELNTGEEIVLMEQYYLAWGYVAKSEENVLSPYIVFYGRPTEDSWYTAYQYNYLTGKTEIYEDGDGPDW